MDLWLCICHADDAAPVAEIRLIGGEHQIKGCSERWRKEARLMAASETACAQDRGAVLMHPLAGMLVRGSGARDHHAPSEERVGTDRRLNEHLSEGGAADIAVAEGKDSQHPRSLADRLLGGR
jgi:hypothetical protein